MLKLRRASAPPSEGSRSRATSSASSATGTTSPQRSPRGFTPSSSVRSEESQGAPASPRGKSKSLGRRNKRLASFKTPLETHEHFQTYRRHQLINSLSSFLKRRPSLSAVAEQAIFQGEDFDKAVDLVNQAPAQPQEDLKRKRVSVRIEKMLKERAKVRHDHKMFGVSLLQLMKGAETRCPAFLVNLVRSLDPHIKSEGLFRLSGNKADLDEIRGRLEADNRYNFLDDDPHALAGVLKAWLRELPDPLLTFALCDEFTKAAESGPVEVARVCRQLPAPNFFTLAYICAFLERVASWAPQNRMTRKNLAIVFGPNLLRPEGDSIETLTKLLSVQEKLVIMLLEHFATVFGLNAAQVIGDPTWAWDIGDVPPLNEIVARPTAPAPRLTIGGPSDAPQDRPPTQPPPRRPTSIESASSR